MIVKGREQLIDEERSRIDNDKKQGEVVISSLAGHVNSRWSAAKTGRQAVETRLLECERRRRGVYSDAKLGQIRKQGQDEIYMRLTGIKCATAAAWLSDVMLQPGERPWSIEPTPVQSSDVEADVLAKLGDQAAQLSEEELEVVKADYAKTIREDMLEATTKMSDLIEDQLIEGNFYDAFSDFIDDLVTYPAAFLKGPILRQDVETKWIQHDGEWIEVKQQILKPEWERVSPFDIYPAPNATDINDAWLIERHKLSRSELSRFIGVSGYDTDAIHAILSEYGEGGLSELVSTDTQRWQLDSAASRNAGTVQNETIDVIELWDTIQGKKLILWDSGRGIIDGDIDPLGEYRVNIWKAGSHVFRVVISDDDSVHRPYYSTSYDKVPGSFWGNALPEVMADIQDVCNGIARALAKNLGVAAGPQVIVRIDQLPPGEAITDVYPMKIWQTTNSGQGGSPIEFYQPTSNARELMEVYDRFEEKADVYTGIPRYTYGSPDVKGAGQTASGLSMLMSAASKGIKRIVGSIDRYIIEAAITRMYHYNMRHHPDIGAKVDANVKAIGAKSLIVKEQMQQKRTEFMNATLNPLDSQIIGVTGRAKLLKSTAQALDLPEGIVPDDSELQQNAATG